MFIRNLKIISVLLFLLAIQTNAYCTTDWKKTVESMKSSVVMVEIEVFGKLENEQPGCYQATGFVIDSKNGIILTNRHVVGASPSKAKATFLNKEKIEIKAIYYDPMHDFGFFKYNPALLKWMKPKEVKLADSGSVKIGEEIRVLGNNASEGFSILEGTVSWIKKNAPAYSNPDTYRDFNTYYFQTSADVSGGSSGGPIINKSGEVIALNSSSKRYTTVSWGLPINLVKKPLKNILAGERIQRGSIGARVVFSPFNEIQDYGFPPKLIDELKNKDKKIEGLLSVLESIPGTDSAKFLRSGDVVWEIEGEKINDDFFLYERILNSNVNKSIKIKVVRNGVFKDYSLKVIDLESLKSFSYVRIGGDHFSNIPIFIAFSYNTPLHGIFTPSINYNFSERVDFPSFLIIQELGNKKLTSVEDFFKIIKRLKNKDEVRIRYMMLKEQQREEEKVISINWKWFQSDYFKFDGKTNEWVKNY